MQLQLRNCFYKSLEYDLSKLPRILINAESRHIFIELEICKSLKDLLKCGLTDGIVFKIVLFFELLDEFEGVADWFIVAFHTKPHIVAVVLDNLHVKEFLAERLDYSK